MLEWRPNPGPQEEALRRIEFEILFGGARGGGKTDAGMVFMLGEPYDPKDPTKLYMHHPRYRGLVIRKNAKDLSDWLDRAGFMYARYGGEVMGNPAEVRFPSGAKLRTGHLKDPSSYESYLGHEYPRLLIEELTQIAREKYYLQILGSCRTTLDGFYPQAFNTTNPGGAGHQWVKRRFVDVAPPNVPYTYTQTVPKVGGGTQEVTRARIFIPSKLEDNPVLVEKDPGYAVYLESLKEKDPELYRAWRHGDWDVFAGQFFREFRRGLHVVPPFQPKEKTHLVGGIDWGYNASFVFLGSAVQEVLHFDRDEEKTHKFNRVWTYKEIAGREKTPKEWAKIIMDRIDLDAYEAIYADPAMFHRQTDGSESIADQFKEVWMDNGYKLKPASNDRMAGWARMHDWLSLAPDNLPYWIMSESCLGLIETLPTVVHSEAKGKIEDLDTEGDDHWVDAARYKLVNLKWIGGYAGEVRHKSVKFKGAGPAYIDKLNLDDFARAKPKKPRQVL